MILSDYNLVYLVSSILGSYIVYKFMTVFFTKRQSKRSIEILTYVIYYFVSCAIYLFVNIPIVMIISSLMLFFLISLNYKAEIKNRLVAIAFIYIILALVEIVISLGFGFIDFKMYYSNPHFKSIVGLLSVKLISYLVVILLGKYNNIKKNEKIPITFWIAIVFVPIGTLWIIIFLLQTERLNSAQLIIGISIMLAICLITFTLYDSINLMLKNRMESLILKQQNRNYQKQYLLIKESIKKTKAIQHDLKKHVQTLESLIQNDEDSRALEYIKEITGSYDNVKEISRTGNLPVDSILNFKLGDAINNNIDVKIDNIIPIDLNISDFDLTVILGNLIDNAIEATSKLENNKYIDIKLSYKKSVLFINIENSFDGKVEYENKKIITRNSDKQNHGLGLDNVLKSIDKYDGLMQINHSENKFHVSIMLYTTRS